MIKDLDIILSKGEGYTVEFKEAVDKSIASEVCAFANASGGRVFIGVTDKGELSGVDTSNTARSRLQDSLNKIEPRLPVDISIHDNIILVTVPEGKSKPYSCPNGFYLRSGPNSQKLERNDIIEFLQTEGKVIYDALVNDDYVISNNFKETEFRRFLEKAGISDVLPREEMLKNLNCAEMGSSGKLSYTNAGLLFFRDNSQNVRFDFSHVVCVLYKGTDKVDIIDAKHLDGGIMENIDDAVVFLKRNLRVRYEIETFQRKNILELPEAALKEAVTNAVCHRDNFEKGARVMIEIFTDRVEITNPGGVPKGITRENFGTTSVTRNPIIASLLHRADYIERMGTGINRMTTEMEKAGLNKPIFQTEGYFFKVTFKRDLAIDAQPAIDSDRPAIENAQSAIDSDKPAIENAQSAIDSNKPAIENAQPAIDSNKPAIENAQSAIDSNKPAIENAQSAIDSDGPAIENSDRTSVILEYLDENGKGQNADFANLLGLSAQRTREILQALVQAGLIEKHGEKRHTYYIKATSENSVAQICCEF